MSEFQKQSNKRDGKEREMEKKVASYSWWWDSHKNPQQSQWLQSTLSDLDQKTKIMLTLIQEDGDSFAKRAEMYYKKRPELVKMVEEFHRSYRSLAERYDQLKSDPTHISGSSSSSSSNSIKDLQTAQNGSKTEETCSEKSKIPSQNSEPDSTVEDPDLEISKENANESIKCESGQSKMEKGEQPIIIEEEKINKDESNGESFVHFGNHNLLEREAMWSEMKLEVSRLMKENLKNQTELIKRNDEKREDIRELRHHIEKLLEENRTLQNRLRSSTKISNRQKLKSLFLGKFQ